LIGLGPYHKGVPSIVNNLFIEGVIAGEVVSFALGSASEQNFTSSVNFGETDETMYDGTLYVQDVKSDSDWLIPYNGS